MNFRNFLIILLVYIMTLVNNSIQSMNAGPTQVFSADPGILATNDILPILEQHFQVVRNEDVSSINNSSYAAITSMVGSFATFNTTLDSIEYTCFAKKDFNFTNLAYQLYHVGYNKAYQLLNNKNNDLLAENQSLNATNSNLIQQLQQKTKYAETIEQPQLREAYKKLNNRKSYLEYCKYFGFSILGASAMGLGIYCYSLLKK